MPETIQPAATSPVEPLLIGVAITLSVVVLIGVLVLGGLMRAYQDETSKAAQQ